MFLPLSPESQIRLTVVLDDISLSHRGAYELVGLNGASLHLPTSLMDMESKREWSFEQLVETFPFEGDAIEVFRWGDYFVSYVGFNHPNVHTRQFYVAGDQSLLRAAEQWVNVFTGYPSFLQAYVVDARFDYFQNCRQLAGFRHYREPLDGYSLIDNDLPPPYQEKIVDVTKNTGRRVNHVKPNRYTEVVAATMWFGETFWPRVGKAKDSFSLDPRLGTVREVGSGVLNIVAADKPFDSVSQYEKLDALRVAIYGESSKRFEKNTWSVGG